MIQKSDIKEDPEIVCRVEIHCPRDVIHWKLSTWLSTTITVNATLVSPSRLAKD